MKMILHDLPQQQYEALNQPCFEPGDIVIADNGALHHCIGCFGCWTKTPGRCVIKDEYRHMGERLAKCDQLVILSRCAYGSYSPFIRNVLDRSISYMLPYFAMRNGQTHHSPRYAQRFALSAHFYGEDITPQEQTTARTLVQANGINFNCTQTNVQFHLSDEKLPHKGER